MHADDVILISVDDHIAEPADMFDAHVPAKYKEHAPRVETDERGIQQWWYGDLKGRNLGLNAVAGVLYRAVARNRYRLPGGTAACAMPAQPRQEPQHPERAA